MYIKGKLQDKNNNVKLIFKAMIDKNINSLEELAEMLFYSHTTIKNWFNGNYPVKDYDLKTMEKILNIKLNWNELIKVEDNKYYLIGKEEK